VTDETVRSGGPKRWRRSVQIMLLSMVAMWAVSALAMVFYTRNARDPVTHELVIVDGTSELIAAGENPLEIPSTWGFYADDVLVLRNEDGVDHWLGEYFVPANDIRSFELRPTVAGFAFCSLHPDGGITIDVDLREFDWRPTVAPTLALGSALGLIVLGTRRVMRLLDEPADNERRRTQGHGGESAGRDVEIDHQPMHT